MTDRSSGSLVDPMDLLGEEVQMLRLLQHCPRALLHQDRPICQSTPETGPRTVGPQPVRLCEDEGRRRMARVAGPLLQNGAFEGPKSHREHAHAPNDMGTSDSDVGSQSDGSSSHSRPSSSGEWKTAANGATQRLFWKAPTSGKPRSTFSIFRRQV